MIDRSRRRRLDLVAVAVWIAPIIVSAVFLWIVPLAATLSNRVATRRNSSSAFFHSPPLRARVKLLIWFLIPSLRARLRARCLRFWRTRFLADNEWATSMIS